MPLPFSRPGWGPSGWRGPGPAPPKQGLGVGPVKVAGAAAAATLPQNILTSLSPSLRTPSPVRAGVTGDWRAAPQAIWALSCPQRPLEFLFLSCL